MFDVQQTLRGVYSNLKASVHYVDMWGGIGCARLNILPLTLNRAALDFGVPGKAGFNSRMTGP